MSDDIYILGINMTKFGKHPDKDTVDLAWQDWLGSAAFDRPEDYWPRRWAEAYLDFAAGEKRAWLHAQGVRWFPVVGWAERGGYTATGHGNSVPRFHITWGTGPGVVEPFARRVREAAERHGKACGLLVGDGAAAAARHAEGWRFVAVGSDATLLAAAVAAELALARRPAPGTPGGSP